jgi:hypothetical protein
MLYAASRSPERESGYSTAVGDQAQNEIKKIDTTALRIRGPLAHDVRLDGPAMKIRLDHEQYQY